MGNTLGGKKTTKVMKINGEEFKLKTPIQAKDVTKDHPGHVLLDSEAVRHYGSRAKPLEPAHELKPRRLYFLVEPPRAFARRVRSGINMSAKDRLESLMLARRSASDLSIMRPPASAPDPPEKCGGGGVRVRVRLRRAEVERIVRESGDEAEAAEKIVGLCLEKKKSSNPSTRNDNNSDVVSCDDDDDSRSLSGLSSISEEEQEKRKQMHWNNGGHFKRTQKRVSFRPIYEGEIQIAVA